ncbi:MAG: 1-acyl-sn-glycerol-3-phosphate acyltransferase [Rubrivivax sp.]|nr:1-acyl-sn-glycerol-3-phosphate acyltransferase [Rubrivivax sp.]
MIGKHLARIFLRLAGWQFEGMLPEVRRFVLIAAPHTSNWDFVFMMAMAWSTEVPFRWMGKASLFAPPHGRLFKALGGVPIRRGTRSGLVAQSAACFEQARSAGADFVLAVPAEGTRERAALWRSGFYHIARLADVPVVLGYLDYARKRGGLGPALHASGDVRADMDRIRAFYAGKTGRHPGKFTPPRLAEEDEAVPAAATATPAAATAAAPAGSGTAPEGALPAPAPAAAEGA